MAPIYSRSVLCRPAVSAGVALVLATSPAAPAEVPNARAVYLAGTVCAGCHGIDGNSRDPNFPKLAGLQATYIKKQIREFVAGTRRHETMSRIAGQLTDEDIAALGDYFSTQKPSTGRASDPKLAAIGRVVYLEGNVAAGLPSCDGCHAPEGTGSPRFPRLAGQHPEYLVKQLGDIKAGRRNTSPLMRAVAERLSDDDMRAVAAYLGGL